MRQRMFRSGGLKRLTAAFLCALMVVSLFPASVFAAGEGRRAGSTYGNTVMGSDGEPYSSPADYVTITYRDNGQTEYAYHSGGKAYRHFLLIDEDGASRWVYCVEGGIRFRDSEDEYYSYSTGNSEYFRQLPEASQYGIKLASMYGWQPGKALPLSGINADDWYMASQCIVWEYQQQLRSDTTGTHANGPIKADTFYSIVRGRPAERVYHWMLEQMENHTKIPSFAGSSAGSAPVHRLKWDAQAQVYRLTVQDGKNLNIDLEKLSGAGVTVTRSGSSYTFTSKDMITSPVSIQYRRNIPVGEAMLIWGRPTYQTMLTGAEDPVSFYIRLETETYGTAKIIKTSEDGITEGHKFRITGAGVDQTVTTKQNGSVDLELLPGTYRVDEISKDQYVAPVSQFVTVESGKTASVHFSNVLKKFRIKGVKTDAETGETSGQGDAVLSEAVYGLYKGNQLMDTYTTGEKSDFLTRYYVCGNDWTLRELQPSPGYLLNERVYQVGASPETYTVELNTITQQVTETVIKGRVQLIKHTDDPDPDVADSEHSEDGNAGMVERPEAGAVFEIYLASAGSFGAAKESERDVLITDADGMQVSKELPYGRYVVHQRSAGEAGADKALVPDFTVFISQDGKTYSYILNNDSITARARVEKRDAISGKLVPIGGTGYRIRDLSTGEFIRQTVYYPTPQTIEVFYTSDEGWLMLPEPLKKGKYELCEETAPYSYVLSKEPVPFEVNGSEAVVTVVQYNIPQQAQLTLTKTGEALASVQETDGLYQPVYETVGLPGTVYDLVADEDVYTGDGTLQVKKDTVVDTLTTGPDAKAISQPVFLGRYRLEEKQASLGMVRSAEPVYVEFSYAGQNVEISQTAVELYNERQKARVSLNKELETDELFGIGLSDEYKDVSFGLYASCDIEAKDGSVIPADGLLEVVPVSPAEDEAGLYSASFAADLPIGSFYVKEYTTSSTLYVLDETRYPVIFDYAGQDVAAVTIAVNDGEAIPNKIIRGRVDGIKYGEHPEGGDPFGLAGALIGLFAPDTEEFTEENALLTVRSGENGAFCFEDVPAAHWIAAEIEAPALYSVSPERHHIYIGTDGQHIEIRLENTLIKGGVQLIKTEAAAEPSPLETENKRPFMRRLPGAVFELYEDVNGNREFDGDDLLLGELSESDAGFHSWEGLLAKGYFVKEKTPPKGFKADPQAYYFEITQDGQTVVIENGEAGQGFVNEAYRGNLKIVKNSSDGRKDGFAFQVTNEDGTYRETFITTETGVIEIKGLRAGIYSVDELKNKASSGYILPDQATVEIKADETAVVQLFNEKPTDPEPDIPEKPVPQTGDDYSLYLLAGLLGLALLGGAVSMILYLRSGRSGGKRPRRPVFQAAFFASMILAAGCAVLLAQEWGGYRQSAAAYEALTDTVKEQTVFTGAETGQNREDNTAGNGEDLGFVLPTVDFDTLQKSGPDVKAWLELPGTVIDYPVAHGKDNSYYLKHLYDGRAGKAGCLFLDYENAAGFADRNTIIYGHNLRDGSMFSSLLEYQRQGYYDEHPQMLLITPEGGYAVELFSAFVASPGEAGGDASPWALDWKDDGSYTTWLKTMQERSLFESGVRLTGSDRVLTLSTCANGGRDRFIVMGRLQSVNE